MVMWAAAKGGKWGEWEREALYFSPGKFGRR